MLQYHPTMIQQPSNFYYSAMLSCLINDISAKLRLIKPQGASELGALGAGKCRRRSKNRVGRLTVHADAELLRELGGIILQEIRFASGHFEEMAAKQRAGRWRAAWYSLSQEKDWYIDTDGDGLINAMDPDSDNDELTDGTEMGFATPIPECGPVKGTNVMKYIEQ